MPTITMDKEGIKALIDSSIKQSVKEAVVELIKSKDDNMFELMEDVALGLIMERDKGTENDVQASREEVFKILDN